MRTTNATENRALKAEGKDIKLMSILKHNTNGLTSTDIRKLTDIPWSTLKNQLPRMESKGYLTKDIEIYKNGVAPGDVIFTWQIRNKRTAFKLNGLSGVTYSAGDRILIFAKNFGSNDPVDVTIQVFFDTTNNPVTEGGTQFGF